MDWESPELSTIPAMAVQPGGTPWPFPGPRFPCLCSKSWTACPLGSFPTQRSMGCDPLCHEVHALTTFPLLSSDPRCHFLTWISDVSFQVFFVSDLFKTKTALSLSPPIRKEILSPVDIIDRNNHHNMV